MSVIIHRTRGQGFSMLPNDLLRDDRMSLKARGLLVTLLSHEDGWQQSIAYAQKECKDGKDAIWSGLRELEALGYLYREKRQTSSGRWRWDHHVYDTPNQAGFPGMENPDTDYPRMEMAGIDKEPPGEEPQDEEQEPKARPALTRPTDRQIYLAKSITGKWEGTAKGGRITIAALQRLNDAYGIDAVASALGLVRDFPPAEAVRSAYAYVEAICKQEAAS